MNLKSNALFDACFFIRLDTRNKKDKDKFI